MAFTEIKNGESYYIDLTADEPIVVKDNCLLHRIMCRNPENQPQSFLQQTFQEFPDFVSVLKGPNGFLLKFSSPDGAVECYKTIKNDKGLQPVLFNKLRHSEVQNVFGGGAFESKRVPARISMRPVVNDDIKPCERQEPMEGSKRVPVRISMRPVDDIKLCEKLEPIEGGKGVPARNSMRPLANDDIKPCKKLEPMEGSKRVPARISMRPVDDIKLCEKLEPMEDLVAFSDKTYIRYVKPIHRWKQQPFLDYVASRLTSNYLEDLVFVSSHDHSQSIPHICNMIDVYNESITHKVMLHDVMIVGFPTHSTTEMVNNMLHNYVPSDRIEFTEFYNFHEEQIKAPLYIIVFCKLSSDADKLSKSLNEINLLNRKLAAKRMSAIDLLISIK